MVTRAAACPTMRGMTTTSRRKLRARPVDYVEGRWPDGPVRQPASPAEQAELYVAEQVVRIVRDIIARRQRRGLRRSQLASLTGLRPNTISDLENGQTWPDIHTLALIAWALEADVEFVGRTAERERRAAEPSPPPYDTATG